MTIEWYELPLEQLTDSQWEALCDGCGRCCMHKLIDDSNGELHFTRVACHLFNSDKACCSDYSNRMEKVPGCLKITLEHPIVFSWLPSTCAYRLRYENKPLPAWHPLLAANNNAIIEAGVSMSGKVVSESGVHEDDYEDYIVSWK